jgi:hypothetical protein
MGKKIGFIGILLLACCMSGYGQKNVEKLFREFAEMKGVNKVTVGSITMTFAGLFTDTHGVAGVEVFDLSSCTGELKKHFSDAVRSLKDFGFETMVNSNENGEHTKVLLRIQDDVIHELVVLTSGNSPAMVRIKGKIKKSDIEKIVNEHR